MTLTDKEKIEKALSKITKIIDKYEKDPNYYGYEVDTNKEYIDEYFDDIKNALLDSTVSDEVKIKNALVSIYDQLNELLDMGHTHDQVREIKKVKSILGQIPALEKQLRQFERELRTWYG